MSPTHSDNPPKSTARSHRLAHDEDLARRMRGGDREAAAEFIRRYGPRLRRRIRSRLGPRMRRVFDSQDILSTLARRLDGFVQRGGLRVESENQLWAFILRMAENATIDKQRVLKRLQSVEGEDSPVAHELARRIQRASIAARDAAAAEADDSGSAEIERALSLLDDPLDREILSMWIAGHPHTVTAEAVGISPVAVRKRWQVIRERLRDAMRPEGGGRGEAVQ